MVRVLRYAGFAEEPEFAQETPPEAHFHVDIESSTLDAPTNTQMTFNGGLSRGAYTHRPGPYSNSGNVVYAIDVRTLPWFVKWALGSYVFTQGDPGVNAEQTITVTGGPDDGTFTLADWTGEETAPIDWNASAGDVESALEDLAAVGEGNVECSGGPFPGDPIVCEFVGSLAEQPVPLLTLAENDLAGGTDPDVEITTSEPGVLPDWNVHEAYATDNQILPSFAARVGKDLFEHGFSGGTVDQVQIQSQNDFVKATVNIVAARDWRDTLKEIDDLLLPEEYPLAYHEVTVMRQATNISAKLREWTLTIGNNVSADNGQGQGSRHPYRMLAGERDITLTGTLYYDSLEHLQSFWGGTDGPAPGGTEEFGMNLVLDAGADGEIDIAAPRAIYTAVPTQPSGRGEITQNVSIKMFNTKHTLLDGATEVRSELLATFQNREPEMVVPA